MRHLSLVDDAHRFEELDGIAPGQPGAHCRFCGELANTHPARRCGCFGCDVDASMLLRWPGRSFPLPCCRVHAGSAISIAEAVELDATCEPLAMGATWAARGGLS